LKRLIALAAGAFGVRALLRRRGRREAPAVDELRAKLAESRAVPESTVDEPAAAAEPEPEAEPVDDVDARRADVHERARRSIDELS